MKDYEPNAISQIMKQDNQPVSVIESSGEGKQILGSRKMWISGRRM